MEQRVLLVMSLMKVNPGSEPSIEKLASAVGLSLSRLRHLFRAEAGMSPGQYYRAQRIRKAKQLIETTFLSMKEIRARVGIRSKDQFTRDFKRLYGRTPAQHRAQRLIALVAQRETEQTRQLPNLQSGGRLSIDLRTAQELETLSSVVISEGGLPGTDRY